MSDDLKGSPASPIIAPADLSREEDRRIANAFMAMGKAAGFFPADRYDLSGDEEGLFIFVRENDQKRPFAREADKWRPVGAALGYVPEDHNFFWLDIFIIHPGFRRQGLGTTLLAALVATQEREGNGQVQMSTFVGNTPMQGLAAKAGFEPYALQMRRKGGGA